MATVCTFRQCSKEKTGVTGQPRPENRGRTARTDSQVRTKRHLGIEQPGQDNQGKTARTGNQDQIGESRYPKQDNWESSARQVLLKGQPRQERQDAPVRKRQPLLWKKLRYY
jgi:hypothetical protein